MSRQVAKRVAMSSLSRRIALVACVSLVAAPIEARAGSHFTPPQSDSRWDAWLGCWGVDTMGSGHEQSAPGVTCIVPIPGSHAVEALTFARGKVVARDRLDANGEPHSVNGQGCHGFETIDWSASGRRALLRSDYVCGSTKGSSSTIYAILPGGDWLRVEQVRSGGGTSVSLERRRPVPLAPEVSAEAARVIEDRRLAISTARAAAAAPITTDEIVEAIHVVDAGVVRSWILASGQTFDLDGNSLGWLLRQDVPQSVVQAMMPAGGPPLPAPALESQHVAGYYGGGYAQGYPTAYANAQVVQPEMQQGYPCMYDGGCNVVPNPYSILNGYGVYPNGYGYGFPQVASFPGGFLINRFTGNGNVNNGRLVGKHFDGHQPDGRRPAGQPVGRGTTGGGRHR
jgi:hypothetical protein